MRRDLDLLDSQRLLETGELVTSDIDQLLVTMRQLTEQAAWEAKKALLGESVTPGVTVLVALEQFEDAVIRSAGAERELRRLARSYREEIWPGAFQGANAASGRLTGIRRSLHDLLDELASAAGGGDI